MEEENEIETIPMEMDLTLNGPPSPMDESLKDVRGPDSCRQKMTQYAKMILPHIGLVTLLTVYTVCGAGIFHVLELPHELKVRETKFKEVGELRRTFVDQIWNMSRDRIGDREDMDRETTSFFLKLTPLLFEAYQSQLLIADDFKNESSPRQVWTVEASIFFATTIITTIGYGNMAPTTVYGRIFCIVFGLFGIPLLLVTIADIGKFLSDFLSFLYRTYRAFKRKLRKHSRRLSRKGRHSGSSGSPEKGDRGDTPSMTGDDESEASSSDELRIPVIMVMFVLLSYTALGGLLFQMFEGWPYFEAFYFCFITMATVGFGDLVPTKQVYMFFTMAYIIVGLALATMCIDLAGTEYIRKIHYVGQKIETARDVVGAGLVSGLHVGEHLLKHTGYGFIRTAGGKLIHAGQFSLRGQQKNRFSIAYPGLGELDGELIGERNILYEPLSPRVIKQMKPHIKIRPEELSERDAYILENKIFNRPPTRTFHFSPEMIQRQLRPRDLRRAGSEPVLLIQPFILKESHV